MARVARVVVPGMPHHITQRGNRQMQTFFSDDDYRVYLSLVLQWSRQFGRVCARSGQWLFRQPEIGENIDGKLPPLFEKAGLTGIRRLAHNMGYVTTFAMDKE